MLNTGKPEKKNQDEFSTVILHKIHFFCMQYFRCKNKLDFSRIVVEKNTDNSVLHAKAYTFMKLFLNLKQKPEQQSIRSLFGSIMIITTANKSVLNSSSLFWNISSRIPFILIWKTFSLVDYLMVST